MTCADCKDLLFDLALGELEPARAAEVAAHARGCPACGAELRELAGLRAAVAPLAREVARELPLEEQPSPAFEVPILAAAREEALRLQARAKAAGTSSRKAAAPSSIPEARARRASRLRGVAWATSIAAAAGLALVVTHGLPTGSQPALEAPAPAPAQEVAQELAHKAEKAPESRQLPALDPGGEARPARSAPAPLRKELARAKPPPFDEQKPDPRSTPAAGDHATSEGPAMDKSAPASQPAVPESKAEARPSPQQRSSPADQLGGFGGSIDPSLAQTQAGAGAAGRAQAGQQERKAKRADGPSQQTWDLASAAAQPPPAAARAGSAPPAAAPAPAALPRTSPVVAALPAPERQAEESIHRDAAELERLAGSTQDGARAAELWRAAAGQRRLQGDAVRAAADLAQAISLLVASGQRERAESLLSELEALRPAQPESIGTARRALAGGAGWSGSAGNALPARPAAAKAAGPAVGKGGAASRPASSADTAPAESSP